MNDPQLTREEAAKIELGHTQLRPIVARALLAVFLMTIALPPCVQGLAALVKKRAASARATSTSREGEGASSAQLEEPSGNVFLVDVPPSIKAGPSARGALADLLALVPTAHRLHVFEETLEDHSLITRALTPWVGWMIKGLLRGGDEQAYFGRDGWLFYRPSVDGVTGPGFLTARWQERRLREAGKSLPPPQPDPLRALLQFHRELERRGITLIVVPVPGKQSIYPEMLAPRWNGSEVLRNPSFEAFKAQLSAAGVLVFDPAPILKEVKRETPAYLKTDTHWSPAGMERVAVHLGAWMAERNLLAPASSWRWKRLPVAIKNSGDIAVMLTLPPAQSFFPLESALITRVVAAADGSPWQREEAADVLLIGDSFSNIYSLAEMGWGDSAGFAEHLSAALGRPLDRLVINAGGAHSGRQELARELAAGRDRLAGKRVVIYEFAARELAFGDWRLLELPRRAPQITRGSMPGESFNVRGRIEAVGRLPQPGTVPYKDCLLAIHLTEARGAPASEGRRGLLLYALGMSNNTWLPVSSLSPGREARFRLRAWSGVEAKYGSYNRAELDDMDLLFLPAFWAEEIKP